MRPTTTLLLGTHNLTEGKPTTADLTCDMFAGQEVGDNAAPAFKATRREVFRPIRDQRQMLAWNPKLVDVADTGYRLYHDGGTEERFRGIRTPHRGLAFARGHIRGTETKVAFAGTWLLNSWGKPWEVRRRAIVQNRELPVLRDWVTDMRADGIDLIVVMGDFNNVRWDGRGLGLRQIAGGGGLDRILVWPYATVHADRPDGPQTGVGRDMRHRSVHAAIRV